MNNNYKLNIIPFIVLYRKLISILVLCLSVMTIGPQYLSDGWDSWLESELVFAAMTILFPWVASSIYHNTLATFPILKQLIDLPDEELFSWFDKRAKFTFNTRVQYVIGISLMVAGLYSTYVFWVPWYGINLFFFYCMMGVFFYFTGVVGWYYWGTLLLIIDLKDKKARAEIFTWPITEFTEFHQKFMNLFSLGVVAYLSAVVGVWLTPGGVSIALHTRIGQFWIFPLAGVVNIFFLCIEYFIHRLMASCKYQRLDAAQSLLKMNFEAWLANPTADDKSKLISVLTEWCENIKKEPEWPLNFTALFTIVGTLLLPAIKTIFDLVKQVKL